MGIGLNKRLLFPVGLALLLLLILLLLNVSIPGREVEGCLEGCARADVMDNGTLTVLSLNILHGRPDFENLDRRLSLIAAEIRRLQVDIALLQEVPWTRQGESAAAYLADLTGMNYAYLRANGNRRLIGFEEGEVVLSRYPLVFTEFSELQPRAGFFEHRVVLHAITRTPFGELDLYVTHLTNSSARINQGQAESLQEYGALTAQHTALIAGDFNAQEESPQIRALSRVWIDAYRKANQDAPGFTCCIEDLSAPQNPPLSKRIDYIFLKPATGEQLNILKVQVVFDQPLANQGGWIWASDHAGVLAEIDYYENE